ncbi:MAG: hypothetical protein LBR37_00500 [Erysipelotrichaceae bacterium]|jgi:hypothetical protein|nr:hypothetical protein [Erysipelotrichaceae bacterium]
MSDIGLRLLVIISHNSNKKDITRLVEDHGGKLIHVVYGHGAASPSELQEFFGVSRSETKIVYFAIAATTSANEVILKLTEKIGFDKPNTGLAFSVPLENLF